MVAKKFHIHCVKITGKYIYELKIESVHFYSCPQTKLSPQVFIITTPDRRKLPISSEQLFLKIYFSLEERGEDC